MGCLFPFYVLDGYKHKRAIRILTARIRMTHNLVEKRIYPGLINSSPWRSLGTGSNRKKNTTTLSVEAGKSLPNKKTLLYATKQIFFLWRGIPYFTILRMRTSRLRRVWLLIPRPNIPFPTANLTIPMSRRRLRPYPALPYIASTISDN